MQIALFTDTYADTNGVSRFIQDLLRQSLHVNVFTSTCKPFLKADRLHNLPPKFKMPIPFYPQLDLTLPPFKKLENALLKLNPDCIHVSTPGPVGLIGRRLAQKHKIPLIGVYHTDFPAYVSRSLGFGSGFTKAYMRWFYGPFSLVLARSPAVENSLKELLTSVPIRTFLSGVDTSLFKPSPITKASIPTLLYVGRMSREKNVGFLLDTYEILKSKLPRVQLICAGDATDKKLVQRALDLGVKYLGTKPRESLPKLYQEAHLFVFPSTTETLGQVVLESLACQTPALVSTIGGPAGILKTLPKSCGIALEAKSPKIWSDTIITMLQNPPSKIDLIDFSIQKSIQNFIEVHKEVLGH